MDLLAEETNRKESDEASGEAGLKGMRAKLPDSLKAECMVRATVEDPEVQKARAEIVNTKSVNELSQIPTFAEFPVPDVIEDLVSRRPGAVERKKRFREKYAFCIELSLPNYLTKLHH